MKKKQNPIKDALVKAKITLTKVSFRNNIKWVFNPTKYRNDGALYFKGEHNEWVKVGEFSISEIKDFINETVVLLKLVK